MTFSAGDNEKRVWWKRVLSVCLCMWGIALSQIFPIKAHGHDSQPGEYQVKAVFILNFAKFVEWPATSFMNDSGTINLCIVGEDPFGADLDSIRGEKVGNKIIAVEYLSATQPLNKCHIAFISRSEKNHLTKVVNALRGSGILSVGDTEGFAHHDVIINFYVEKNRVKFEINEDAAKSAGIRISAKLMNLAKIVRTLKHNGH